MFSLGDVVGVVYTEEEGPRIMHERLITGVSSTSGFYTIITPDGDHYKEDYRDTNNDFSEIRLLAGHGDKPGDVKSGTIFYRFRQIYNESKLQELYQEGASLLEEPRASSSTTPPMKVVSEMPPHEVRPDNTRSPWDSVAEFTWLVTEQFTPGTTVRLTGLKAAPELNGVQATCISWDTDRGRVAVRLSSGEVKNVTPDRLEKVEPSPKRRSLPKSLPKMDFDSKTKKVLNDEDLFKKNVFTAVRDYIEEHQDTWSASLMRNDIAEKHGFENDERLVALVKASLQKLGLKGSGAHASPRLQPSPKGSPVKPLTSRM